RGGRGLMREPITMLSDLVSEAFEDIRGVGLDMVDVTLLSDLLSDGGQDFVDAYWTVTEQADSRNQPEHLAGRWAAKEAVMKCLEAGVGDVDPIDIEIVTLPSGAPRVVLRGRPAAIADDRGVDEWHVSITHEAGWAAAIAIAHRRTASRSKPTPTVRRHGRGL